MKNCKYMLTKLLGGFLICVGGLLAVCVLFFAIAILTDKENNVSLIIPLVIVLMIAIALTKSGINLFLRGRPAQQLSQAAKGNLCLYEERAGFHSILIRFLGGVLIFLGGVSAVVVVLGIIGTLMKPENGDISVLIPSAILAGIAFVLIRNGYRLILRGSVAQQLIQAAEADMRVQEIELQKLENVQRMEVQREEARIQQHKDEIEQFELKNRLVENERMRAVELAQTAEANIRAQEIELQKQESMRRMEMEREEARIQQQKYEIEQLELKNRLAENERMRAIELEIEKQREREEEMRRINEDVFLTSAQISLLEQKVELPQLDECELVLQRGEVAIYGSKAAWSTNKSTQTYEGHIYITNQRIGFVSAEKGFILYHSDIVAVGTRTGGLILQVDNGAYILDLPRPDLANMAFKGLRSGMRIAGMSDEDMHSDQHETGAIRDVSMVDGMDGHSFEYFCAELLKKNGFSDVEVTKGSGDQGVDILASKDGIKYAIQCKNYASKLGNTPIQEVNTGKTFYNCHVGVVMTNTVFTTAAVELANSTNVLLWDREILDRYIKQAM